MVASCKAFEKRERGRTQWCTLPAQSLMIALVLDEVRSPGLSRQQGSRREQEDFAQQ